MIAIGNENEETVLAYAAGLEHGSTHPLAIAITEAAKARSITPVDVEGFETVTGKGVTGLINDTRIALGNNALMEDLGVETGAHQSIMNTAQDKGHTVMLLAVGGALAGLITVHDPIKGNARESLEKLRKSGLTIVMATGDNARTAQSTADELAIDHVSAGLLPEGKAEMIKNLQAEGAKVAMAGDGINDAPALAQADVGIAMGDGSDVAIESAGITLLKGDLEALLRARTLSLATVSNIKQNLFFAFCYNAIGVPIAAGVLYPVSGFLLSPMFAAAAMSLSSVSVITNALRLRTLKL